MTEIDQLRAEVAELRAATGTLLAALAATLPALPDSARSALLLTANIGDRLRESNNPTLDQFGVEMLLLASAEAAKRQPHDPELQALFREMRKGTGL